MRAIGMIETRGLVPSIESADAMLKSADVELVSQHFIGSGLVTIIVTGDVGSVTAAVDAGRIRAEYFQALVSSHIIARPADDMETILQKDPPAKATPPQVPSKKEEAKEGVVAKKKESALVVLPEAKKTESTRVVTTSAEEKEELQEEKNQTIVTERKETVVLSEKRDIKSVKLTDKEIEEWRKKLQTYTVMQLRQQVRRDKNAKIPEKQLKSTTKEKLINLIIESRWNVT